MTKQIEAETLREWLDVQQPITVLDIRDLNEAGELPTSDPMELEAGANRCAVR